jgi:hypothetical protein
MVHASPIAAKVAAVNAANKLAMEIYPTLRAIFEPYVGQKVEKADGGLLAKIAKLLPDFPCKPGLHVYKLGSNYSLAWVVKTCESSAGRQADYQIANYHETTVYIGNVTGGVLSEFCKAPELRTDYTVEAVEAAREAYRKAKQAADDAHGKLHPFGEYDR